MGLQRRQFFLVSGAALLLTHCKTLGFKDVWMSTDAAGKHKTKEFLVNPRTNDGVYCQVTYSSGRANALLTVSISGTTLEGADLGSFDFSQANADNDIDLSQGDGQVSIQFTVAGADTSQGPISWPEGIFTLDLKVDGKHEGSTTFTIATSFSDGTGASGSDGSNGGDGSSGN